MTRTGIQSTCRNMGGPFECQFRAPAHERDRIRESYFRKGINLAHSARTGEGRCRRCSCRFSATFLRLNAQRALRRINRNALHIAAAKAGVAAESIPMNRVERPADIAKGVEFLTSDDNRFVR